MNGVLGYHVNQMLTIAINAPRTVSDYNEEPIIVFIDEFQEVLKVRNKDGGDPNCLGNHQDAVESLGCPYVITGSAKSLILYDILRTGPLFARFRPKYLEGMDDYFARGLAERKADIGNAAFGEKKTVLWFFSRKGFC